LKLPISLAPFQRQDYFEALPYLSMEGLRGPKPERFLKLYLSGPAFTLRDDGVILACFGCVVPWRHLGNTWAIITPRGHQHPVTVHRTIKRTMLAVARALDLRRLESEIREDFDFGHRWVRVLGFQRESRLPVYGPDGETFYKYVFFPGAGK
jgi:hypothetical protein